MCGLNNDVNQHHCIFALFPEVTCADKTMTKLPILLLFAPSLLALDCFSSKHFLGTKAQQNQSEIVFMRFSPDTRPCDTVQGRDHKEGIADIFLNVVDLGIDIVQTLTNSQFIDDIANNVLKM